jgi:hypothetical protein
MRQNTPLMRLLVKYGIDYGSYFLLGLGLSWER